MPKTEALYIMDDKDRKNAESNDPASKNFLDNFREGSFAIPIDILEQKLLLHKGLVLVCQGEYTMAKEIFVNCINTGNLYDPRI